MLMKLTPVSSKSHREWKTVAINCGDKKMFAAAKNAFNLLLHCKRKYYTSML